MVEGRPAGLCLRPPAPEEIGPGTLVVLAPAAPLAELRALAEQPLLGALVSRRLPAGLDPADGLHRQLTVTYHRRWAHTPGWRSALGRQRDVLLLCRVEPGQGQTAAL
ncbi:MAG: hypothetical protein HOV70_03430, partial [Streptomyces sp.]|nr:hypothetical protein [Streptomyces sp.]